MTNLMFKMTVYCSLYGHSSHKSTFYMLFIGWVGQVVLEGSLCPVLGSPIVHTSLSKKNAILVIKF